MSVTITLPIPRRELHPNARVNHFALARVKKAYRLAAFLEAKKHPAHGWKRATARATFFHSVVRERDGDGALSSLKSAYDGIQDAGLVANDSGITHEPVLFAIDRVRPRVEITITETR